MAKALRTAAFVVGAAALVATGVGALAGAGALGAAAVGATGTVAGISTASIASFGAIAGAASGALSLVTAATAPRGTVGGNATSFKIDKEAGIPVVFGRTSVGGNVVHRQVSENPTGKMKNQLESWVTVLSLGPVKSVGPLVVDKTTTVSFTPGGVATGFYAGNMWLQTQLGACPEPAALQPPFGPIPGWSASSKLSGLAADFWSLDFDSKGIKYPNGVPQRGRVVEGMFVYDARQDSTYPGGSGSCRLGDETSYVYSENPGPHAVTWAYGRYQNGVRMAGGEMRASGIDLQPFVEWSNVCDANGWKVGGQVYTDSDDAYDILKMICQAGSAEPLTIGAQLSVVYSAPRVSIGTLTSADVCGDLDVPAAVSKRLRRNTIVPKVRLESHGWEMVPLEPVSVTDYVTLDGGRRSKEITYPLVQDADQGAMLAMYDMLNARELDGIIVPAKAYALGYRPGDCLTLDMPEANLIGREVIVREREIDVGTMGVTFTCRTEDRAKHDYALGKTGTPPPTPDLSNPGIDRTAPSANDWSAVGARLMANGVAIPALVVIGSPISLTADEVFDYRPFIAGAAPDVNWLGSSFEPATLTRKEITSVTSDTQYEVGVRYRIRGALSERLILGPVTTGEYEGVKGEDGTDGFIADSDVPVFVIESYSNGTPKPSWTGGTGVIRLTKGGGAVTDGVTYSIGVQENIASLTLDGARFNFAGLTADAGSFVVNAIYQGVAYSRVITVKRVRDGSAAFRSAANFSGESNTASGGGNTTVPQGRTVTVAGSATYYAPQPGANHTTTAVGVLTLYWRNATDNGPLNYLGEVQGSTARSVNSSSNPSEPEVDASPGQVAASFTFTSPSPDKQIEYRADFRSSGAPAASINGIVALELTS
ncbi:hypothetical protein KZ810_02710 [Sphingomonas sp. RHCKR47]|uniref:hypothetical protein n=1 Tax=Sphingomonas citricola TaxID=2862498 RepID=UPI001CA4CF05|nr:hypothetical protein [Sphingomonas citricola]MBW6522399.1 hypothetical protein [Sphingomonas citricola]